eukprot:scaffold2570_cov223-Alexandrium_tamarense.AAC.8
MADLVLDMYLRGGSLEGGDGSNGSSTTLAIASYEQQEGDIFTRLANDVSICIHSREDGGKIGWVDNPNFGKAGENGYDNVTKKNEVVKELISSHVIEEVFKRRVKGGDVVKLPATTDDDSTTTTGWHLIRVDDLYIQLNPTQQKDDSPSKNRINKVRPKLKGSGVIPLSPLFQKVTDTNTDTEAINNGIDNEEDNAALSKMIYSIPNAKHYKILTAGCQMNVADSERIMGVLEGELGLTSLDDTEENVDPTLPFATASKSKTNKQTTPDILLLNTCTIRDHAEQKVYDALGPYASLKRAGKPLAIVVAGCVAQQEGEALLRRFPEIDLVLGPQYIPWLGDLLVEVGKGSQLCMTESMIWSEKGGSVLGSGGGSERGWNSSRDKDGDWMVPIKRGHSVRAWVNVIYGCNE